MLIRNRIKTLSFSFAIILLILFTASCYDDKPNLDVDLSNINAVNVKIKRYEKTMFAIPLDSFLSVVPSLKNDFPVFLDGDMSDSLALLNLKSFFSDPYLKELNDLVQKKYPNLDSQQKELAKAMQHYYYYFDFPKSFSYYSYVSGLDINFPVKVIDSNIVIGLDLFLGKNTKAYELSGFPKYKSKWLVEESMIPDAMSELARGMMPENDLSANLLDQMIYEGKRLFFIQSMIPEISDTLLLHYSKSQLEWCENKEGRLWSLMIDNQFLFKNDVSIQKKFMDDAPFTSILSTEAPARLGHYLGWRIVSKYMARGGASLQELLEENNSQKILKISKFKPER
jgi:uncharacterized protein YjaZ